VAATPAAAATPTPLSPAEPTVDAATFALLNKAAAPVR